MSEHANAIPSISRSALPDLIRDLCERGLTIDAYRFLWLMVEAYGCRTIGDLIRWAMEQTEAQR